MTALGLFGLLDLATAPFTTGIAQRALIEIAIVGAVGGVLGCWIVLSERAYAAESLAHGMLPGLVVAALIGVPLAVGGAVGIAVAAVAIAAVRRLPGVGEDSAVAVAVTTLFGLGVLLALEPEVPAGISGLLFGDILGASTGDVAVTAILATAILTVLWLLHWRLLTVGFDRTAARAVGVATAPVDVVSMVLLAAAVLVAVQGLGTLLVIAVLVAPAATARLIARRLVPMMALAAAIAVAAGAVGLTVSYYADLAAGAAIAAVLVGLYLAARLVGATVAAGRRLAQGTVETGVR